MYLWQTRISQPKKAIRKDKKGNKKKEEEQKQSRKMRFVWKGRILSQFFCNTHTNTYIHTRGNILSNVVIVERMRRQFTREREMVRQRTRKLFFFIIVCLSKKQLDHISMSMPGLIYCLYLLSIGQPNTPTSTRVKPGLIQVKKV